MRVLHDVTSVLCMYIIIMHIESFTVMPNYLFRIFSTFRNVIHLFVYLSILQKLLLVVWLLSIFMFMASF